MTTSPTARPAEDILLTAHQVLAYYHALHLQIKGLHVCRPSATTQLNRRAGTRWTAKRWLDIITPHYQRITAP